MIDMMELQTDYLSIPARTLTPLLKDLSSSNKTAEQTRKMLLDWDFVLDKNSIEAGIYVAWENEIREKMADMIIPEKAQSLMRSLSMKKIIDWLIAPSGIFGNHPMSGRDRLLIESLEDAVQELRSKLGSDMDEWQYGQEAYKHIILKSPLSGAVNEEIRQKLEVGPVPRGGNSYTVGNTGGQNNQSSGASFRIVLDLEDWDKGVAMNNPGQSDNPDSKYYDNLFELWAKDKFFPLFYSRDKVESVADEKYHLIPEK